MLELRVHYMIHPGFWSSPMLQLVHWNFVKHGRRSAHCSRAALFVLDKPTTPNCRLQFDRLVLLYKIDKEACLSHCDATGSALFAGN